jgi:hypothetical protein
MKLLTTLTLLLFLLSFWSCDKITVEKNDLPQGFSVSQIIGTWKVISITSDKPYDWDGNGTVERDIYSTWNACEKDNLFQFNNNYSGSYKLNCNETKSGSWGLSNTNILFWAVDGSANLYETIIYMSTSTMKTEVETVQSNGEKYTLSKVWKLQ